MDVILFPWNVMDVILFLWYLVEFYGIQVECHGMPWTLHYCHGISVKFHDISVEFHGIQKIGTLTKLVSGSKQWKSLEFGQQNGCQQKILEIF